MTEADGPPKSIMLVLLRFPAHSRAIRRLVAEDENFRGIVDDYLLAVTALKDQKNQMPVNLPRLQEYTRMVAELEAELLKYLGTTQGKDR